MKVESIFREKRPVISFEIFPPKRDTELKNIDGTLEILSRLNPDFISVTFGAGGSATNNKTIALAKKIKNQYGITPIVHLTCLNYSKSEIDEILSELNQNGIENVLALRGDRNPDIEPKKEFHYATDLVKYIKAHGNFDVSGACYPEGHLEAENMVADIHHLREKVDAGASHLISQLFFDNNMFYSFQEKAKLAGINVPIEAGIMPVINKAQIERMVNLCGASLPEKFRRIMDKYENDKEALFDAGMAYAVNQIVDLLAHDVDGIHIYTMNNTRVAEEICKRIEHLI
ncbi:methylenetetrahydrofolate reductase [NAD(P)H] [Roseburia sp. MSJ-14]|uniref:methylenetetrahydrofolate reductase [NAD(P)H] n=1 Tax=Roseburia sp. MSJ-14 TaxID=2841514 RepID=UPI001C0FCA3A|nr:methylenetetrahydrofolate reductase [NAD(P)H] [Roseburia sp. MSJ-14]MBU5472560.1 methylenetetrahydrofolate reductase [NAD(P)H] [Roseburia sp. MSJ-14]